MKMVPDLAGLKHNYFYLWLFENSVSARRFFYRIIVMRKIIFCKVIAVCWR